MGLPVWQALQSELQDAGLTVVTVAEDAGGVTAARQWIEAANPSHPSLVDEHHIVSELYDMVNVPTAVWIDEEGTIVRPPEPAGAEDSFRAMDRTTFALPQEARTSLRDTQRRYLDAIRDWAANGSSSRFALSADQVLARLGGEDSSKGLAAAEFRMGEYLHARGFHSLARQHFDEALQLRPESWNYRRQAFALEDPAKAGGPEYWAAVDDLGEGRYYPELVLESEA